MILTIKRPHNINLLNDKNNYLYNFLKQGNNVKRCVLNYFKKNKNSSLSDCEKYIKTLNNIDIINASWIKTIVNSQKNIDDVEDNLFGDRKLFNLLAKNQFKDNDEKIKVKKEYKFNRNTGLLMMRGSTSDPNTNRCGKIEFVDGILNVYFNINKDNKYHFIIDNIERNQLEDIKLLCKLVNENKAYFNIGINKTDIFIQYDNSLLYDKKDGLINDRHLSLDLNPNEIGVVITEKDRIIEEKIYYIKDLIDLRNANKTDNELNILGKIIVDTALHYKCSKVCIEKLKLNNHNIKIINEWNVKDIRNSINKWCDKYGIIFKEVKAYYSSFIGCYLYPDKIDCLSAAMEIAIRSYLSNELVEKRIKDFLSMNVSMLDLPNRWKKEFIKSKYKDFKSLTLKELYSYLKKSNSKKYYRVRVRFSEVIKNFTGFSLKSKKSLMMVYDIK
jgi:hypothetical protein